MDIELAKVISELGLGGLSLALFFRLGKVVAGHEIRIGVLEHDQPARHRRRK
jgi:hypothetical protein